jgi:hypothetical protein
MLGKSSKPEALNLVDSIEHKETITGVNTMVRTILAIPALVIPAYDSMLHLIGLIWFIGGTCQEGLTVNLPWLLWPCFDNRQTYDLVWLSLHLLVALSVLGLVLTRKGK